MYWALRCLPWECGLLTSGVEEMHTKALPQRRYLQGSGLDVNVSTLGGLSFTGGIGIPHN